MLYVYYKMTRLIDSSVYFLLLSGTSICLDLQNVEHDCRFTSLIYYTTSKYKETIEKR